MAELPSGWRWTRIGDQFKRVRRKNEVGVERILTASGTHGLVDQREFFNRRVAAKDVSHYLHVKRGEFAYNRSSMDGYPFGAIKRLDRYDEGALSTLYIAFSLRPKADICSDFAAHLFESTRLDGELGAIAQVGARAHGLLNVTPSEFFEVSLPLPPLPEQRKIAAILSSVGDAIAATRKVIEQTERAKQGLLQSLMTRGIGHTRFKQTEIGEIPEEWSLVRLAAMATAPICYGILKPGKHIPDGVPVVKVKDMDGHGIQLDDLRRTSHEIHAKYARSEIRAGDVLLSIRGTVGRLARVPDGLDGANITQDTARIRVREPFGSEFVRLALQGPVARKQIELHTIGQAVKGINLKEVRRLLLPLPSAGERREIVRQFASVLDVQRLEGEALSALQLLKRGVLQDLLTGRVRVTPD